MKILLAVTGGVAIYKACSLTRALVRDGHEVQVIMSEAAQSFISPKLFEALSGKIVPSPSASEDQYAHLDVGKCDAFIVAPATANTIAKMAHGLSDDIIGAAYLATTAKVYVAPAMNVRMLGHLATQANLKTLEEHDVTIIESEAGELACGDEGDGRMASIDKIIQRIIS